MISVGSYFAILLTFVDTSLYFIAGRIRKGPAPVSLRLRCPLAATG
jgi:hypothetical protein